MSQCTLFDIEGAHPQIPTQFDGDTGSAIPIANVLTLNGLTNPNGTFTKPIWVSGSGATLVINAQVGAAITGAPADSNDAGLVSFDDTTFSVDANGYVTLIGGGTAMDSFTTDVSGPVVPTGAGVIDVTGTSVFSDGSVANTLTLNVQATANTFLVGAGAGTTATEFGPLTNGQLIIGSTGLAPVAGTLTTTTVANATNATPLFVDVGAGTLNVDLQVGAAITGAPLDSNDAGIVSFDDTEFVVDANGFVSLAGTSGAPAIQKIDGDGGGVVGPNAAGTVFYFGEVVANGSNSKPLWTQDTPASNRMDFEIQVGAAITGAPADKNDAGLVSFDDTEFTVDTNGFVQLLSTAVGQTITGDSGGALSPTAGNWNIVGGPGVTTSGSGSTLTINSVVYTDQAGSTSVVSDSGSFATGAVTLTLPASPAQGERCEFIATSGILTIQTAGTQVIHIGGDSSTAGGTATGSATGDSISLIYQSSTDDWWNLGSPAGVWTLA